jgi:hypothetical protein
MLGEEVSEVLDGLNNIENEGMAWEQNTRSIR